MSTAPNQEILSKGKLVITQTLPAAASVISTTLQSSYEFNFFELLKSEGL